MGYDLRWLRGDPQKLARELKAEGQREFRRGVRQAITRATKPVRREIRDAALDQLPKRGGLNVWAAVMPAAITNFGADRQSVTIRQTKRGHNLKSLDAGRVRHPVFGNRKVWRDQSIKPGYFSETVAGREDTIRRDVREAIEAHLKQLEGKVQ